jgi:hypothetical protein
VNVNKTYARVLVTASPASKFWLFLLHREMCSDWLFGYAGDYRMQDLRIPQAFKLGDESHPVWQDLKYAVFFSCVYPVLQHVLYKTVFEVSVLHLLRLFGEFIVAMSDFEFSRDFQNMVCGFSSWTFIM